MRKNYWRAVKSLYGEQIELGGIKGGSVKKDALREDTEVCEQIRVATWLAKKRIVFYHIPNGGYRRFEEAVKLKNMGVAAGVPDICIPIARKGYHGLYIELKRESGGKLSEAQRYWGEVLMAEGYAWHEAKGARECIGIICHYLGIANVNI
jgi:hypothetical protein